MKSIVLLERKNHFLVLHAGGISSMVREDLLHPNTYISTSMDPGYTAKLNELSEKTEKLRLDIEMLELKCRHFQYKLLQWKSRAEEGVQPENNTNPPPPSAT